MVDPTILASLQALRDLLIEEVRFLYGVSDQVKEVERELDTIHCFLMDADKWPDRDDSAALHDWIANLKELAFRAENVLEKYAVEVESRKGGNLMKKLKRSICIVSECFSVHQVGKEAESIRSRLANLTARLGSMQQRGISSSNSSAEDEQHLLRLTYAHEVEEHFVGMEEDIERLVSLVKDEQRSSRVISICGMGGLGKTTLARKVYNHKDVQGCFHARAWVCVTQQFEARAVLRHILKQFLPVGKKEQINDMEQTELVEELLGVLMTKKCLVVIDDIWEADHWSILKPAFPITEDNCKVLLTTRNEKIASQECLYGLGCLTEDQGWELLRKIALPRNYESGHLEATGRKMVQKCGRLPLAISVIGGILHQKRTLGEWEGVSNNIDSYLKHGEGVGSNTRVKQVLDLSYNVLPYYLKSCFLYLGCFPEDQEIDVERLYVLWMAEGLIAYEKRGSNESLRDVAERHLSELAFRCLVQVQKNEFFSPHNKFRSCRLHDLMRDLCLSKGEEKRFLKIIDLGKHTNYDPSFGAYNTLAIHFDGAADDYFNEKEKLKGLRSLFLLQNEMSGLSTLGSRDNSTIFNKLKFLRILVLEYCRFERRKLPSEVGELIHLRYLSLFDSHVEELPLSLFNLQYLQTLDLRVFRMINLPNVFCKLKRLKHLFLNSNDVTVENLLTLGGLKELETLQEIDTRWVCIEDIPKLKNLRRLNAKVDIDCLSIIVQYMSGNHSPLRETILEVSCRPDYPDFKSFDFRSDEGSDIFRKMLLSQSLVKLSLSYRIGCSLPCYEPELCRNLVGLSLYDSELEGDAMEILGKFPVLQSLSLGGKVFNKTEMTCNSTSFSQLKVLELMGLPNLERWVVERGAMPNLFCLAISGCKKLEMIPDGLSFIATLDSLICFGMPCKFNNRLRMANGQQGEDYHKVCHIPFIELEDSEDVDELS